ncbi:MAG TPA: isoleucine--tRNA ligase [Candidatus Saccharimonadales bacterium]|nr:isoleucine--tRNA ligase [Candidatus Saccharimonadales bacterium]
MKFRSGTRRKAADYEKAWVKKWKEEKAFEQSVASRPKENSFVFYDGPPFITGVPHHGTLLTSIVKDAIPRYWTMKGKRVERVWGWDCHGLPAEVFTEEKLGIKDKRDIGTKVSLEEYVTTCRANMVQTGSLWEDTIDRVGRWVDFEHAYKTMDKDYMESVWWAFKQLYEKGKIYEGEKVLLYCTRDATPISKAEVAMDNSYKDVTDPTVYAKFKLKDDDTYLVAWTTTPWTLPSNSALAVNKSITYAEVELEGQRYVLAEKLLDRALTDAKHQPLNYKIIRTFRGEELVGKSYEPLFATYADMGKNAFRVWHADFVHEEEGTGIAHESPAYGEEDYQLSHDNGFPWVMSTDENGFYTDGRWKGKNVWEANKDIAKTLLAEGKALKIEYLTHSYPHCHRCGTRLMYRAHPSWFMDIDGQRTKMLEKNSDINWFPEHIKHGRFENTVQDAPDWNISRDRFWATAMPVWRGRDKDGKEKTKVIGSYKELEDLSGKVLDDYHRPWVDDIEFELDGVKYKRIEKVLDCWFESGSMPFAQYHYPFENVEKFEENFPGDFVVEYVPQVRAWFYYMHAVAVGLFGKEPFKNVIVHGTIAGNDGRKMSKSYGNYTDPTQLMNAYSADALRFLFLSSPLLNGEDFSLKDKDIADVSRKLSMIWNMYDFFTLYAEVDKWEWNSPTGRQALPMDPTPGLANLLDIWIISRLHQVEKSIDENMQEYDIPNALKPLMPFIDDASNWYVRRSRKRFWKSEDDTDKADAYKTLHYVLTRLSIMMAPFTPFLSEELYTKLTGGRSVHLLDWPEVGHINEMVIDSMELIKKVVSEGLSLRSQAGIKVRQPLNSVDIRGAMEMLEDVDFYRSIIAEELNVKEVKWSGGEEWLVSLDTKFTPKLKREGLSREIIRHVQNSRKEAGLKVDDRIILAFSTDNTEINRALSEYEAVIKRETLATKITAQERKAYKKAVEIDGHTLALSFDKA